MVKDSIWNPANWQIEPAAEAQAQPFLNSDGFVESYELMAENKEMPQSTALDTASMPFYPMSQIPTQQNPNGKLEQNKLLVDNLQRTFDSREHLICFLEEKIQYEANLQPQQVLDQFEKDREYLSKQSTLIVASTVEALKLMESRGMVFGPSSFTLEDEMKQIIKYFDELKGSNKTLPGSAQHLLGMLLKTCFDIYILENNSGDDFVAQFSLEVQQLFNELEDQKQRFNYFKERFMSLLRQNISKTVITAPMAMQRNEIYPPIDNKSIAHKRESAVQATLLLQHRKNREEFIERNGKRLERHISYEKPIFTPEEVENRKRLRAAQQARVKLALEQQALIFGPRRQNAPHANNTANVPLPPEVPFQSRKIYYGKAASDAAHTNHKPDNANHTPHKRELGTSYAVVSRRNAKAENPTTNPKQNEAQVRAPVARPINKENIRKESQTSASNIEKRIPAKKDDTVESTAKKAHRFKTRDGKK